MYLLYVVHPNEDAVASLVEDGELLRELALVDRGRGDRTRAMHPAAGNRGTNTHPVSEPAILALLYAAYKNVCT